MMITEKMTTKSTYLDQKGDQLKIIINYKPLSLTVRVFSLKVSHAKETNEEDKGETMNNIYNK